jgi:hypothetical protein
VVIPEVPLSLRGSVEIWYLGGTSTLAVLRMWKWPSKLYPSDFIIIK